VIKNTLENIIATIAKDDEKKFKDMIGVDLLQIGKNEELLHLDFQKAKSLYEKYLKIRKPEIIITEELHSLGNQKVIIPFYKA
jgi:hypothetical protein